MGNRIFIIDDEDIMVKMASNLLNESHFHVSSETNPILGLEKVQKEKPDLLLLDLKMPKLDGFEVLKRLKSNPQTKNIPVIIVSIQKAESDVVAGLELGAVDYIQKPFREGELLARIKANLRKKYSDQKPSLLESGPIRLDLLTYKATLEGKPLNLNPLEFKLLAYFLKRDGQVLTRQVISENVWERGHLPTSNTINSTVDRLRGKLGVFRSWIHALKGVGYRFEADE